MAEEQNRTLQDKFMLRMPDGMRDRIKAAAATSGRSMNAEIVATLEEKYPELEGIEKTLDRIHRLIVAARAVGADHILHDLELDLDNYVSDALREHAEISKLFADDAKEEEQLKRALQMAERFRVK